jgi:maltose phosphorylase
MTKFADKYLETLEWGIAEKGFHPDKGRVSESLFSLANERMGVRGYFEEGYSGDRLVGSYLGGVYEELRVQKSYKGVSDRVCFMVNTLDWLRLGLVLDGERLDLASSAHRGFFRELDFRTGLLSRSFTWIGRAAEGKPAKELELRFERLLSMDEPERGQQRLTLKALNFSGPVRIEAGLDFSPLHEVYDRNYWTCGPAGRSPRGASLSGVSVSMGQVVSAAFELRLGGAGEGPRLPELERVESERYAGVAFELNLEKGREAFVEKASAVSSGTRGADERALGRRAGELASAAPRFEAALEANRRYWKGVWERADIAIEGDPENQQGIRFCVFQLEQTYRGLQSLSNIGAKGLTGEFYNGNYFWDTETYCFPYYLATDRRAAKALLEYRYRTLPQAMERARDLDCRGACYPLATIDGTESCTLWQHASLQLQPTTAVAYAIRHYELATGDAAFLYGEGLEMLIQIARFLASRAQWSEQRKAYGYFCVMGPDEFQMMVHNNAYTNYMGAKSLAYAADLLARARSASPEQARAVAARVGLEAGEAEAWLRIASLMCIPRGEASRGEDPLLFEQHEGYFGLPHVDKDSIPAEEFPLYHHWSYDRIYRNDMIKQPDVLMFMLLYNSSFSLEEKRANYEFYEPRCIHESSLSPSVHSILAQELGNEAEAYEFFKFATRIDLDDYNRNAREGLHMTAIAAAWMNIVYGFAGFRSDKPLPSLAPGLPAAWKGYSCRMRIRGGLVSITVSAEGAAIRLLEGEEVDLELYGEALRVGREGVLRPLRAAGAAAAAKGA